MAVVFICVGIAWHGRHLTVLHCRPCISNRLGLGVCLGLAMQVLGAALAIGVYIAVKEPLTMSDLDILDMVLLAMLVSAVGVLTTAVSSWSLLAALPDPPDPEPID